MNQQDQPRESPEHECSRCGHAFTRSDKACEVLSGRYESGLGRAIVCTKCAKKAGIDVGAFARPVSEATQH